MRNKRLLKHTIAQYISFLSQMLTHLRSTIHKVNANNTKNTKHQTKKGLEYILIRMPLISLK